MAALVHLVRHAEVDNPDRVVCGSMPGFGLSPLGIEQARRVARYLGPRPVVAIWSSPLERALRTSEEIAARSGVPVRVHADLTDWQLMERWKGHRWNALTDLFPGEVEAYLAHPESLDFVDEQVVDVATRMARVARALDAEHPHGDVVIVSHEDSIQAGWLHLTGADLAQIHENRPANGSVLTLRPGTAWRLETGWEPTDTPRFGEKSDLHLVRAGQTDGPSPA